MRLIRIRAVRFHVKGGSTSLLSLDIVSSDDDSWNQGWVRAHAEPRCRYPTERPSGQRPRPVPFQHLDRLGNLAGDARRICPPLLSREVLFYPASHYPCWLQGIPHAVGEWIGEFEGRIGAIQTHRPNALPSTVCGTSGGGILDLEQMTTDTNTPPESLSEPRVPASAPLKKRLIGDHAIIRMRAEGATLDVIALAAGLNRSTISAWLRHPRQAEKLKQETQLVRLERQAEKREAEAAVKRAKAEKRKATRDAKAAEPVLVEWDKENGERFDAYVERASRNGQHGRVLTRRGPIHWS
jgi:hypothetical protein